MSEIGILPKESEVTTIVASGEFVSPPDPIKEASEIIVRDVKRSISEWPEYTNALLARQRARGKIGPYDRIVFEKDGKVYVVAMRGAEESNIQDTSVRVAGASAIPANLSLDDLNGTAELPPIEWDNILQVRSVKEEESNASPSIGYQDQEVFGVDDNGQKTWQYNTQAAVDGAKRFAAEITLKAPNPIIETTGRVIE